MNDVVFATAPSNIALIKYMGKLDANQNIAANPSFSLTLNQLNSLARIERSGESTDGSQQHEVSFEGASQKFHIHIDRILKWTRENFRRWELPLIESSRFQIKCTNSFYTGAGIASSASSFAAVTSALALALTSDRKRYEMLFNQNLHFRQDIAQLSRQGSGSSGRSFYGPWVRWNNEISSLQTAEWPAFSDLVVVCDKQPKKVSSTDAHRRVQLSQLWRNRVLNVNERFEALLRLFAQPFEDSRAEVSRLVWDEAFEMHSLFHTARPPFFYMKPATIQVLEFLSQYMTGHEPPFVTMDAGPNIHILVPTVEVDKWKGLLQINCPGFEILCDDQGKGVEIAV